MLNIAQLARLKNVPVIGAYLHETLSKIITEINGIHTQTGSASGDSVAEPPTIAGISVTASNGFFSIKITDPAGKKQLNLGLHYFLEWDTNKNFPNPTSEDIGTSFGEYLYIGSLTTYWRATSQFRNSPNRSPYVYFGSAANPTGVAGGGGAGGTPPGGGSGTAGGGGGFGGKNSK